MVLIQKKCYNEKWYNLIYKSFVGVNLMPVEISVIKIKRRKMPSNKVLIFLCILLVFIALNALGLYFGNKYYNMLFKPDTHQGVDRSSAYKSILSTYRFSSISKEDVSITSQYGYELKGLFLKNKVPTKDTIIILHDVGSSSFASLKYAELYLTNNTNKSNDKVPTRNFNVLIYDSRDHGNSGGDNVSYGYYEKDDLNKWVSWLNATNKGGIIGIHADGLGATTALLQSGLNIQNKRVKFYIADCAIYDLQNFLENHIRYDSKINNNLLVKTLSFYTNIVTFARSHFTLSSISPSKLVSSDTAPTLFIHGDKNTYSPVSFALDVFKQNKIPEAKDFFKKDDATQATLAPKYLYYIAPNSDVTQCYVNNTNEYKDVLSKFLSKVVKINTNIKGSD